jgi:hypothetical protein
MGKSLSSESCSSRFFGCLWPTIVLSLFHIQLSPHSEVLDNLIRQHIITFSVFKSGVLYVTGKLAGTNLF